MRRDYPPELKTFHVRSMFHGLLVMTIPFTAWSWAYYRQEKYAADDQLQTILTVVFCAGVGAFMLFILFKALVSKPKCPECRELMTELETITITEKVLFGMKEDTQWRIVCCNNCDLRYRIPGLS